MVIETLTSVGEVILLFQVMPYYGTMMAFALMFSLGLIPSLCKLLFSHYSRNTKTAIKAAKIFFDILAFLVQVIGIGYPIVLKKNLDYVSTNQTYNSDEYGHKQWAKNLNGTISSIEWQVCDDILYNAKMMS